MRESLTLSFSQISNQLVTHFNNSQLDKFIENPENYNPLNHIIAKSNPSVNSKLISNLYPRSILYDYLNGTGDLNPFTYFEPNVFDNLKLNNLDTLQQIITTKPIDQITTTTGAAELSPRVKPSIPQFWSDFSKVTYNPHAILKHPDYLYDVSTGTGIHKNNQTQGKTPGASFQSLEIGKSYFPNSIFDDSVDEIIRKFLENSNNVTNINVVLEFDTSWTGICSELVNKLIDEHLNGKGSKINVWSIQRDFSNFANTTNIGKLDRIRKFSEFNNMDVNGMIMLNSTCPRIGSSNWEKSAYFSIPFEFFNTVKDTDLNEVIFKLTDGGHKKFINEVRVSWDDEVLDVGCKNIFVQSNKQRHVFARSVVSTVGIEDDKLSAFGEFDKLAENGTSKLYLEDYKSIDRFRYVDTLPKEFSGRSIEASSIGISSSLCDDFSEMFKFVSKYCRTDEREQLKDDFEKLKEDYTFGCEADDEEEDDGYYS